MQYFMAGAEETDELKELAEGLEHPGVRIFLGQTLGHSDLLSAMDIFIFPVVQRGLALSRSSKRRRQGSRCLRPTP